MKVAAERLPIDAFVEALGRLDFAALAETMADDVTFRALVPPGSFSGGAREPSRLRR